MWKVVQELLPILLIILIISQIVYPILMDKPLFWLFRKEKKVDTSKPGYESFDEEVEKLSGKYDEKEKDLNEVVESIEEKAAKIAELKSKTKKKP